MIAKRIKAFGFDVSVETPKGTYRHWKDPHSGESGSTKMLYDYGYIRRTEGTDGDHVDVYVGPDTKATNVYIINQTKKPDFKEFDEQKVMLGFPDAEAAKTAYLKHYNDPRFFGDMTVMSLEDFRKKVLDKDNHGKKIATARRSSYEKEETMPFKSKAQARAAFGGHIPGFSKEKAEEWAHETKNMKKLPEHVKKEAVWNPELAAATAKYLTEKYPALAERIPHHVNMLKNRALDVMHQTPDAPRSLENLKSLVSHYGLGAEHGFVPDAPNLGLPVVGVKGASFVTPETTRIIEGLTRLERPLTKATPHAAGELAAAERLGVDPRTLARIKAKAQSFVPRDYDRLFR